MTICDAILRRLRAIEREHGVRILYAWESAVRGDLRHQIPTTTCDSSACTSLIGIDHSTSSGAVTSSSIPSSMSSTVAAETFGRRFYVLRPLLAIYQVEQGMGVPPVEIERLVDTAAPVDIRAHIDTLVELKRSTPELGLGPPIAEIGDFIRSELKRHGHMFSGHGRPDLLARDDVRDRLIQPLSK